MGQEAEAESVLEEALRQLQDDPLPASGDLTVKTWGERWIEDRKARDKREWTNERAHLEFFLYPLLGRVHGRQGDRRGHAVLGPRPREGGRPEGQEPQPVLRPEDRDGNGPEPVQGGRAPAPD